MDSKNLYIVAAVASLALSLAHYFGVGFTQSDNTAIFLIRHRRKVANQYF